MGAFALPSLARACAGALLATLLAAHAAAAAELVYVREAGCPYCFTVDGTTLNDQTVTVRDRDTGAQERISMDAVARFLQEKLGAV